jgi:DNA polymerase (family 10)
MLNNKQIALKFDLLAKLMELHDDNPFKIRSYANAYLSIRKLEGNLDTMPIHELEAIKGVGATIAQKIKELLQTGDMNALRKYQDITPQGVQQMLSVKGLGPKKVKQIWKEMEITTVGELLYACQENRLIHYKGFGQKVQDEIKHSIEYFMDSQGKFLYAYVYRHAEELASLLKEKYTDYHTSLGGDIRRMLPEVSGIEIVTDIPEGTFDYGMFEKSDQDLWTFKDVPVQMYFVTTIDFIPTLFAKSCSHDFLGAFTDDELQADSEKSVFLNRGINYIPPECRESAANIDRFVAFSESELILADEIKGIVHSHSTFSDGLHSLEDMAEYVKTHGYEYFVISDHSKSAGYANGLTEERLQMQWSAIDKLNATYGDDFHIFKGIESDILVDGHLDYSDDILKQFDVVIASIHSVLQMDVTKATNRLIKAIENPYTTILGHPTGRLLLARPGYPVDHIKIIDACAANGVAMELNANPQRLDIDWSWIPYCMEKNVPVSINPDAHSKESIHYVKYGVHVARKGLLTRTKCLNTKNKLEFASWCKKHTANH